MRILQSRGLNMNSKHRLSMFHNMASQLIQYERIKTTRGKAKGLVCLINHIFKKSSKMDSIAKRYLRSRVRIPTAYNKILNGLVDKYRYNI
jgi:ribosomal protein L17